MYLKLQRDGDTLAAELVGSWRGADLAAIDAELAALDAGGARRVVVVRAITEASDPRVAARALKDRLGQAWADDPALASYALRSASLGL